MSATVSPPNFSEFDDTGRPSGASAQDRAAFGQYLAAGRRRSNLSIEDVAAITKLKPRLLEALERGDIEELPAGVYRRAMVKGYASAVGLRPDAAIEQFDRTFYPPPPPAEEPAPVPVARREPAPRPPARASTAPGIPSLSRPSTRSLVAAGLTIVGVSAAVLLMMRQPTDDAAAPRGDQLPGHSASPTAGDVVAGAPAGSAAGTTALIGAERSGDVFLVADPIEPVTDPLATPHLVVTSRPSGARVTVDGIGWGVTPIRIRNLPPGMKVIRATKDGYVGSERSVQFGMTDDHTTVRLVLRPQN